MASVTLFRKLIINVDNFFSVLISIKKLYPVKKSVKGDLEFKIAYWYTWWTRYLFETRLQFLEPWVRLYNLRGVITFELPLNATRICQTWLWLAFKRHFSHIWIFSQEKSRPRGIKILTRLFRPKNFTKPRVTFFSVFFYEKNKFVPISELQ